MLSKEPMKGAKADYLEEVNDVILMETNIAKNFNGSTTQHIEEVEKQGKLKGEKLPSKVLEGVEKQSTS